MITNDDGEELSFFGRVKEKLKKADTKLLIKGLVLAVGILLAVVLTIAQVGFDPENIDYNEWIGKTILNVGLIIFGIVMGESIADDRQRTIQNGMYQRNLIEYRNVSKMIELINIYFSEFLIWYTDKETENKRITYLNNKRIKEARDIVKFIEKEQIDELLSHPIKLSNGKIIPKKSEEEVAYIKHALDGTIIVHASSANYYTSAFETTSTKSVLEVGRELEIQKNFAQGIMRACKIGSALLISLIWSAMTVGDIMDAKDMQAWVNLVSRITGILGGLFSGYCSGITTVKIDARKLENKATILKAFKVAYDSKEWQPYDFDNLAKQEYEKYLSDIENTPINTGLKEVIIKEEDTEIKERDKD